MELSLKVKKGHTARKREFEGVRADEQGARVDERIAVVRKALAKLKAPLRSFPQVIAWEDTFLTLRDRWNILVLCADSQAGKSNFAEDLFENPFVLTVEAAQYLDLKGFDYEKHDGLVLDNVNSWGQLLSWRAILQGRNAKSKGGQSATNVYSYWQYLFGVPVVATVDLDAPDKHLVDPEHEERSKWLLKNCVIQRLEKGDVFYEKAKLPKVKLPNEFSLFAATLKRRRCTAAETSEARESTPPRTPPRSVARTPLRRPGPPLAWEEEDAAEQEVWEQRQAANSLDEPGDVEFGADDEPQPDGDFWDDDGY